MEQAVNALEPWVPRRILADVKTRWVRVERTVLRMQAEIDALLVEHRQGCAGCDLCDP